MSQACPICGGAMGRARAVQRAGRVGVCTICGSWFRLPRPTAEQLAEIYTQQYYDSWGLRDNLQAARDVKLATLLPLLGPLEPVRLATTGQPRLLDVGAATGLLAEAARMRGWDAFAVELNPYAIQILRGKLGAERVFQGELTDCPFAPGSFGAVTMTDLIEHVLDVPGVLRKSAELLCPGGMVCITTPRVDSFSRVLLGAGWLHFKKEHLQYLSSAAIDMALRSAGFDGVRIRRHSKRLSIDYVHLQLQTYRHPALSGLVALARSVLPSWARRRPVPFQCGEMLVTARRPG